MIKIIIDSDKKQDKYNEYQQRIYRSMDFIYEHLYENPSLEEIAESANFSKYYFHRIFYGIVGEKVAEFTRRLKQEKAAHLLHYDKKKSITDIAYECGFSSSQNFSKSFQKHFSMSPRSFRNNCTRLKDFISMNYRTKLNNAYMESQIKKREQLNVKIKKMPGFNIVFIRQIGP